MSGTTTRLNLYLAGGGSTAQYGADEVADVDKLNANFVKIDATFYPTEATLQSLFSSTKYPDGAIVSVGRQQFSAGVYHRGSNWQKIGQWHPVGGFLQVEAADLTGSTQAATQIRDIVNSYSSTAIIPTNTLAVNINTGHRLFYYGGNWVEQTFNASAVTSGTLPSERLNYGVLAAMGWDGRGDSNVAPGNGAVQGDWNNFLQPGVYRVFAGNGQSNYPNGAYVYGTLLILGAGNGISSRTQVYFAHTGGLYWRTAWNGNDWGSWRAAAFTTP